MEKLIFSSLPMFVSGFWAVLLFCSQIEKHHRSRLILALFMVVATIMFYAHCVFFNEFSRLIPVSDTVYTFGVLACYPMFYLYLVSMTSSAQHLRRAWLCLLPALFMSVTVGVLYAMMSEQDTVNFIGRCLYREQYFGFGGVVHHMAIAHLVIKICFAITVICVMLSGMNRVVKYEHQIKAVYSNIEGKSMMSFKIFLYLFFFASVASFVLNIVGRYRFCATFWALTLPSVVFSILIFILGMLGFRQTFTYESMDADMHDSIPQQPDVHVHDHDNLQAPILAHRIEEVMEEYRLFLQPNLKLSDLAAQLCTNRLYISQAINSVMCLSFSDYINKKRIEYAAHLITDNPEKPIADIAFESGFASQNSFYRNFKNFKGCSPKVYIHQTALQPHAS